ncbi:hypothetical protein [Bartonella schoenbuchensis]|uniref:hypothetical protein n=1 Tax=Bartonella schoenbuchensis TaxID=165694 RepID=UPI0031450B97
MVMRRVFNRHVCLCVLSTAILAGLALMTSQTKVYAQPQNCKGLASGKGGSQTDSQSGLIVCDGGPEGKGTGGELSGRRDIDMSKYSGQAAVTVYNKDRRGTTTNIRIVAPLTVTDSIGGSNTTAIKVYQQGVLTVMNATVEKVQKGIVVDGSKSSVTVMKGSIGVRKGGDAGPVIEVSKEGKVVLMEGVKVGTISGSNAGEVVIENGGDVTLMGTRFDNVKMGIVVKGTTGMANVKGGATINLASNGTGFKMQGQANADVMELNISGGNRATGVDMGSTGTLRMTRVGITTGSAGTGAKVTSGTLELLGKSTIQVVVRGKGMSVTGKNATVMMNGVTMINVEQNGKGLEVTGNDAMVTVGGNDDDYGCGEWDGNECDGWDGEDDWGDDD